MTVSVSFATTTGEGAPVALPQNAGTISPGGQSSALDFYVWHDGSNEITNCKFYILPYSAGVYLGSTTAQDDYDEMIAWGDASYPVDPTSGGGAYINMNASGSFPSSDYQVFRTSYGASLASAITLDKDAVNVSTTDGKLPAGAEAHIKMRVDVPAAEGDTGIRYFDMLMAYTSTS